MKKIMFNERFGLTQAVLDGRKTMTRRIIGNVEKIDSHFDIGDRLIGDVFEVSQYAGTVKSTYRIGEDVAVAQSYKSIVEQDPDNDYGNYYVKQFRYTPGWTNKMFVRADLMPHRIRITNIRVERLQDISEEDCLKEGIQEYFPYIDRNPNDRVRTFQYFRDGKIRHRMSPAPECFALLIDDICGHGTWQRNPWVFAYEFKLV